MSFIDQLKRWAKALKKNVITLWFCQKHPDMPWFATIMAIFVVAYAFSPIDLIPDFIPIISYLDDLIIVPVGIYVTLKLVPVHVFEQSSQIANEWMQHHAQKPRNWCAAFIVICIWLLLSYCLFKLVKPYYESAIR